MRLFLLSLSLLIAISTNAQTCGNGLPCGAVPWTLPQWAPLESPTPLGGGLFNVDATPTGTPPATATATGTPDFGLAGARDSIATISAIDYQLGGTPLSSLVDAGLSADSTTIFSYVKGVQSASWGPFTPIVNLGFLIITVLLVATFWRIVFPIIAALFGLVRRIVSFVLDFLPF